MKSVLTLMESELFSGASGRDPEALTSTTSSGVLIGMVARTFVIGWLWTETGISRRLKPSASLLRTYSPERTLENANLPSPSLLAASAWPVALFINVSCAPGITAPLGSSTEPLTFTPVWALMMTPKKSTGNMSKRAAFISTSQLDSNQLLHPTRPDHLLISFAAMGCPLNSNRSQY